MAALSTAMMLVMIAQGIAGLRWSPTSLKNNAVVYACATGTLSLPWNVTVAPGDTIADITWFVSGTSQEMIAVVTHGNFLAMPAFANRVRQLTNGGIELDHVGLSEKGNYSVEVAGRSSAGLFTTLKRTVSVIVADDLLTTDGQLHVSQEPKAGYDVSTDQYYVLLGCGTFTYPTHPGFEVTWETPSGQRSSSGYDNGSFHLRLDGPVQGGVYTCRLPPVSACGHGNGSSVAVSLAVDKTETRLLLMEARQARLDTKSRALEQVNTDLVRRNHALQAELHGLKNRTAVLENQQNATGLLIQRTVSFNPRLWGLLTQQTVSFHARIWGYSEKATRPLDLSYVFRNHGDGYNDTTSVFTAPFNGTYCFLATVAIDDEPGNSDNSDYDPANGDGMDVRLYVAGKNNLANIVTKRGSSRQPASLQAVVALFKGDKVALSAEPARYWYLVTSFSGFLIDHTPGVYYDHNPN